MKRITKPTPDNRTEALAYWWRFLGRTGDEEESIKRRKLGLQDCIDRNEWNAVACAHQIAMSYRQVAEYERWHGLSQADMTLRLAFASFYLAVEFERVVRVEEKWADTITCGSFWDIVKWQGLAAACGEVWFVDWVAPYLQQFLKKEVAREHMLTLDEHGRQFLALLQETIVTKQWPSEVNSKELGAFAALFNSANDASKITQTLMDFCDYRLAQTYGYPSMDAEKKRKRGKEYSIYEESIFLDGVWPTELLTLQHAYQQATGKKMSLDALHPLLQSNLMKLPFPKLTPIVTDETNEKIKVFAKKLYGEKWQSMGSDSIDS